MSNQINDLQGQVDALWHHVNSLRAMLGQDTSLPTSLPPVRDPYVYNNEASRAAQVPQASMMIDPSLGKSKVASQQTRSQSAHSNTQPNYDLAKSSLQTIGLAASEAGGSADGVVSDVQASSDPQSEPQRQATEPTHERALADLLHTAELQQNQMTQTQSR